MSIVLNDAGLHSHFLPLTFTRPVGQLRPGILRLSEGWYIRSGTGVSYRTEPYLSAAFPLRTEGLTWEVNAGLYPTDDLVSAVMDLRPGQVLIQEARSLAFCLEGDAVPSVLDWMEPPKFMRPIAFSGEVIRYERPWHLFQQCGMALKKDHQLLTEGRRSQPLSSLNTVVGDPDMIFLEEGAVVEASVLNTRNGPIHIGRDAEVMEGCIIRGPFALGEHSQLKMGAKIYGPTAVGPECRVGGEVNNSIFTGYSNKGHDGFLGNSVLGEWCNLGADTNTSNLKNTYGEVQAYSYADQATVPTGAQFLGSIMGDHVKSGINTMFNTGTVVGVASNIFGSGFPPKFIPSFSWGGSEGLDEHDPDKAIRTARRVMERRSMQLTGVDEAVLRHIFSLERPDRQ